MEHGQLFGMVYPIVMVVSIIVFWICWSAADMVDTGWYFGNLTASHLGMKGPDDSDLFFNNGCRITGLLMFIGGAIRTLNSRGFDKYTGAVMMPAGILLALVGCIPLDVDYDAHCAVAMAFGIMAASAIVLGTVSDLKARRGWSASFGCIILLSCAISCMSMDMALAENCCILLASVWIFMDSIKVAYVYRKGDAVESF